MYSAYKTNALPIAFVTASISTSFPSSTLVCTSDAPAKQGPAAHDYEAMEKDERAEAPGEEYFDLSETFLLGFGGGSFTNRSSAASLSAVNRAPLP